MIQEGICLGNAKNKQQHHIVMSWSLLPSHNVNDVAGQCILLTIFLNQTHRVIKVKRELSHFVGLQSFQYSLILRWRLGHWSFNDCADTMWFYFAVPALEILPLIVVINLKCPKRDRSHLCNFIWEQRAYFSIWMHWNDFDHKQTDMIILLCAETLM